MKSWSLPAAAATLALHALLAAALVAGLSNDGKQESPPVPVKVQLLQPVPPPVTPVMPAPPVAAQVPKKKPAEPKPRAETKPAPAAQAATGPQVPASTGAQAPAATVSEAPIAAAPVTPPAPARTSASDASYGASNRKPPYPRRSRSNDEQGTVLLRVLVKADGTAGAVEIKNSSGYPLLDESARSTVQTWRFKPATVDGKPVAEWYQLAVPFTLQDN
jgi:periplasmic protein TonB